MQGMFDFAEDDGIAGFRLNRFEILNWGTFDRHIWVIPLLGHNGLLTGDIGSGKSTLVDALTTLLVPSQRITYNKAAGAETKERSLTSYVRGHYKSEKDSDALTAKAVALRENQTYSVMLGYFYNQGYEQGVTLAQVFWLQDNQSQPNRFFVVADGDLTIAKDFSDFGADIQNLKRRLRKHSNIEVFDSFSQYSTTFRRKFGIENSQAMDLFYQTVSMKSVGNLTDFIRQHMLEAPPVAEQIDNLCQDFENLNRAFEAVQKAKAQIQTLTPLVEECDRHQSNAAKLEEFKRCHSGLYAYFASKKILLLDERIQNVELEWQKLNGLLLGTEQQIEHLRGQESEIKRSLDENGGRRLADLNREIKRLSDERDRLSKKAEEFRKGCQILSLPFPRDADEFYRVKGESQSLQKSLEKRQQRLETEKSQVQGELGDLLKGYESVRQELESLKARRTKIPLDSILLRERLCETLGLDEVDLPFAGELLRAAPEESKWEGAIERLLHSFGLSMLVPDTLYSRVAKYVDQTHLKGKLVYFRVKDAESPRIEAKDFQKLFHKIQIKTDSPFYHWLASEVHRRFDHICAENLEEFQRHPKAITMMGQIKSNGVRHEKDDRHGIGDRSRHVLGWSNQEKIHALEVQLNQAENQVKGYRDRLENLGKDLKQCTEQLYEIRDIAKVEAYLEIHWEAVAQQIQVLEHEKRQLEQASNVLLVLQNQLKEVRHQLGEAESQRTSLLSQRGSTENKQENYQNQRKDAVETLSSLEEPEQAKLFEALSQMQTQALPDTRLTVENCDKNQTRLREWLETFINQTDRKLTDIRESIVKQMMEFKHRYPQETQEMDAAVESGSEYRQILLKLNQEDLPRHEKNFKQLLNERTINNIVMFQNWLEKQRGGIKEKITRINKSLRDIEYNPGSYIELELDAVQDQEIRQFQQDLKACTGETMSVDESEIYAEHKFLEVKKIIDRFHGQEHFTEADKRWTQKVTDVRNWFMFSARERWAENSSEKEYYPDSAGKSGGQKEKLAYTILASALAYQFGLEWGAVKSRSFRFVMIDEAFGRGSDDSARYALELFKKLNLQLLIVTPLQKIQVIEDYVRSVHLVHNREGRYSSLNSLTIKQYQAEKARYKEENWQLS